MKNVVILFFVFISINANAQINIGPAELVTPRQEHFKDGDIDLLKKTTTLFIYRSGDVENLEEFKTSLSSIWDITELEFISWEEYKENTYDESYSFITLSGSNKYSSNGGESTFLYLTLWLEHNEKKMLFFRIDIFPSFKTLLKIRTYSDGSYKALDYMYSDAEFRNWNQVFLKNYLQYVNKSLKEKKERWLFKSEVKPEIKKLKTKTLYIPNYILIEMNKFSGDESKRFDAKKIMKDYKYKYRIVGANQLSKIVKEADEPIYYLSYVKSNTDKFITITNSETGEIIYSKYKPISYNFKSKDIKAIMKEILK